MKVINKDNTIFDPGSVVDVEMLTDHEWELRLTTDTEPPGYVYLTRKEVQVLCLFLFSIIKPRIDK